MKRILGILVSLSLVLQMTACRKKQPKEEAADNEQNTPTASVKEVLTPQIDKSFSGKDADASYEVTNSVFVNFSEEGVVSDGEGVLCEKTTVRILSAGTYILAGNCANGKIVVETEKTDKVKLVLNNLDLTCKDGAPLVVIEADKVFLTLDTGSQNTLSDGTSYTETIAESTHVDGTIFSRADLTINGTGNLTVHGNNKHGIVSKDDLILSGGGTVTVIANGAGFEGKDCVKIREMQVSVTSEGDGMRSTNTEDPERGFVYVKSGSIRIRSQGDGISAETLLQIDGGDLDIQTGGGAPNAPENTGNDMMGGGMRPGGGFGSNNTSESDTVSQKGLKCTGTLLIKGGKISVDAYDDGIHSDGDIAIEAGEITLLSGDDGIHAEGILEITGSTLTVAQSYEGLEAKKIYIKGGILSIVASDDGLNATDGNGGRGMGGFGSVTSEAYLCIEGGYLLVDCQGDGLDSNGNFDMKGGIALISGPTNGGNGALDYGDGCAGTVSGGILIATGASGMAENFTNAQNQGAMLVGVGNCAGGTNIALSDADGKVIASFTPQKAYQTAVITAPGIEKGGTYKVHIGGAVSEADENGFAVNGSVTGATNTAVVEMTSLLYGSGGFGGGGGMRPGGGGMRPGKK